MLKNRLELMAGLLAGVLGVVCWLYALFGPIYASPQGERASVAQMSLNPISATFFGLMLLSIIGVVVGAYLDGEHGQRAGLIVLLVSTALTLVGTVLSSLTVGMFFLPATIAALGASIAAARPRASTRTN